MLNAAGIITARQAAMPVLLVCPLAWVLAFSQDASVQSWADAYRAGDSVRAADLLHPIVTDFDRQLASPIRGPRN